jgi:hypothetical protein
MKCEEIRDLILDYLSGALDSRTKSQIDEHTLHCSDCKQEIDAMTLVWEKLGDIREEDPGPSVGSRFYAMLDAYHRGVENAPQKAAWYKRLNGWMGTWWPRQPVFQFCVTAVVLAVGLAVGLRMNTGSPSTEEVVQLRQEMADMRQLVTLSLLNQSSANERLRGVYMSRDITQPDDKFLSALVRTLNSDPNVSVRLAVVDALHQFSDLPEVRTDLVTSLPHQTSTLVQISLIDTLVRLREPRALDAFKTIADDPRSIEQVKKRARMAINTIY